MLPIASCLCLEMTEEKPRITNASYRSLSKGALSWLQGSLFHSALETRTKAAILSSVFVFKCCLFPDSGLFTYVQLRLLISSPCTIPWSLIKINSKWYSMLQLFYRRQAEKVWAKSIEIKKQLVSCFGCLVLTVPPASAGLISLSS